MTNNFTNDQRNLSTANKTDLFPFIWAVLFKANLPHDD